MVQRIGFYFGFTRSNILEELTLDELYLYNRNSLYFFLESQGKPVKKPSNEQQREYQNERKARLKKLYGED